MNRFHSIMGNNITTCCRRNNNTYVGEEVRSGEKECFYDSKQYYQGRIDTLCNSKSLSDLVDQYEDSEISIKT